MKIAVLIARSLLGLVFLIFGLNFFLHFMPMKTPPMSVQANAFQGGLFGSGYFFQFMKVIEIISGFFLLINRFTALYLLVLFPISLNIFLFHLFLAPAGLPMAIPIIVLHLFLGYAYFKYYVSIFSFKTPL
jgi:putative oxidoreductase